MAKNRIQIDPRPVAVPWDQVMGRRRPASTKYPFDRLAIGASLFVRGGDVVQARAVWAARAWQRRRGAHSLVWAREVGGIRFWRVRRAHSQESSK